MAVHHMDNTEDVIEGIFGTDTIDCEDGIDNDGDGWIDNDDIDCKMGHGIEVNYSGFACNNGLDDDGDGLIDAEDTGCVFASDINEIDPVFCM